MTVASATDISRVVAATANVLAVSSPITVTPKKETKDHFVDNELELKVDLQDPDSMTDPWLTTWSCGVEPSLSACMTNNYTQLSPQITTVSPSGDGGSYATTTIPGGTLISGLTYTFTMLANRTLRTALAIVSVKVKADAIPLIWVERALPTAQVAEVNPTDKIILLGAGTSVAGGTLTYQWSSDDITLASGATGNLLTALDSGALVVKPNVLFSGATYTFMLTVTEQASNGPPVSAQTQIDVIVNDSPQAGTVGFSPTSGVAGVLDLAF